MEIRADIQDKLDSLPAKPGVYLYRDEQERVIYVGKSVNLRNRVRSYFHVSSQREIRTHDLVERIFDLDFIVTDTEVEALILECELIKKHRPRFNVRLKDDKRYPYLKITWYEDFPRIYATRRMEQDGSRYFGPFTSVDAVHHTLDLLRKLFPYRTCNREITGHDKRACLYYYMGRCLGPCIGKGSREEYRAVIDRVSKFLEGHTRQVLADLQRRMQDASARLDFEAAAAYRDQIQAVEQVTAQQKIISLADKDQDVVAFARDDGQACVQVFFIRAGKLIGREYFVLEGATGEKDQAVLEAFIQQFYDEAAYVPPEILMPHAIEEAKIIESWLRGKRGSTVRLRVPQRGPSKELIRMAADNATETLNALRLQWEADQNRQVQSLSALQEALGLANAPARIEGYDISTFHGSATYGSMVVFVHGVPRKSEYRRFRVKSVIGHSDDYASIKEVLRRRFQRTVANGEQAAEERKKDPSFAVMPNLVLIDGGKGQLNAALEVLCEYGLDHLAIFGLAKREEEIFMPGQSEPICLPRDSPGLFLVQRIRDEAHRFAISVHRRARDKGALASTLEVIPGVGPQRRKALLRVFGSMDGIRSASVDELAAVDGMNRKVAERIKETL